MMGSTLGYPIPNPYGLYEEACVLYDGDPELISRDEEYFCANMELRNGQSLKVTKIRGYADPRLHALYEQKSLSELYQAFHRARPFGDTRVKEVLVFTDVPVKGVPVDGFLGREGRVFDILLELHEEQGGIVELPILADAVIETHPNIAPNRGALDKWIRRNADWLSAASNSEYVKGTKLIPR